MLANIIKELGPMAALFGEHMHMGLERAGDFAQNATDFSDSNGLPSDTSAQFSAGLLYAWSGQTIDKRDYLVNCTLPLPFVKYQLGKAFDDYNAGDLQAGNQHITRTQPLWQLSMILCPETWSDFRAMIKEKDAFFARDDWPSVADQNYDANKDYVDQQWQFALNSWNTGVYFNAGMFYGRVYGALSATTDF